VLWFAIPYVADEFGSVSRVMSTDDGTAIKASRSYSDTPPVTRSYSDSSPMTCSIACGIADYARHAVNEQPRQQGLAKSPTPTELGVQLGSGSPLSSRKKLTALVIDDTKTVCKLMDRLLMKMGFESVKCYENGSKGLEAMMAGPVDIVFSDVQMPIMTGPEVNIYCYSNDHFEFSILKKWQCYYDNRWSVAFARLKQQRSRTTLAV